MQNKTVKQSAIVGFLLVVIILVACPAPDNNNNFVPPRKWSKVNTGSTTATPPTLFSERYGHSSVELAGDIYVIGGSRGGNEVWKSSDGTTWNKVTPDTPVAGTLFSARSYHSSIVIGTDMYVIAGSSGGNEVWKSSNKGVTWSEVTPVGSPAADADATAITTASTEAKAAAVTAGRLFSARFGHSSALLDGGIYVIGGTNGPDNNEVWVYK